MITTELRRIFEHMEWADALVWSVVDGLPGAEEHERLGVLLHHVHTVQWVYLRLWRDEPVEVSEIDDVPDLASIRAWGRRYHAELPSYLNGLGTEDLARPVEVPWADALMEEYGEVRVTDLRETMLQVGLHSAYHRGQVNTLVRTLGGEPPLTDLVAWVWAGRPAPKWPGGAGSKEPVEDIRGAAKRVDR